MGDKANPRAAQGMSSCGATCGVLELPLSRTWSRAPCFAQLSTCTILPGWELGWGSWCLQAAGCTPCLCSALGTKKCTSAASLWNGPG